MDVINVTYGGVSAEYVLDGGVELTDDDVRRIAVEVVRAGELRLGLAAGAIRTNDFDGHVVDRFRTPSGERRIYLRPKVPFG